MNLVFWPRLRIVISLPASSSPNVSWWYFIEVWVTTSLLEVSRTLLGILSDLNNTVVLTISILPPIPNYSNSLSNLFGTIPSAPIIIEITVTFMILKILSSLSRSKYLSLRCLWFSHCCPLGQQTPHNTFF